MLVKFFFFPFFFENFLFLTFHICTINTDRFPGIDPAMTEKRWWLGATAAAAAQLTTANLQTTIRGSQQEHLRSSKETIKLRGEHTGAVSPLLLVGCYSIGIQRWYKTVGGCIAAMPHKMNRSVIKRRRPTSTATIRVRQKKKTKKYLHFIN